MSAVFAQAASQGHLTWPDVVGMLLFVVLMLGMLYIFSRWF